jgi:hypothetical protein
MDFQVFPKKGAEYDSLRFEGFQIIIGERSGTGRHGVIHRTCVAKILAGSLRFYE